MDRGITLKLGDLEKLESDLKEAIHLYPDKAQDTLEQLGKKFRNETIKETYRAVTKKTGNLQKGYKLSKVRGYGKNMEIDFAGTAPHFHLIENGHEIILPKTRKGKARKHGGENRGFVPGRLIVKKVKGDFSEIVPKELDKMTKEILRECEL